MARLDEILSLVDMGLGCGAIEFRDDMANSGSDGVVCRVGEEAFYVTGKIYLYGF